MGKHIFTLNLRTQFENAATKDEETGELLEVSPGLLYDVIVSLRNELLADAEELTSSEFQDAMVKATEVNNILARLEDLGLVDEGEPIN